LNQDLQQFIGVSFDGPTNLDKFYNIDAPLAAFVFGDKGLRLTESFGVLSIAADSASAGIQTSAADFGHSLSVFFDVPVGYTFDTLSGHDYSSNAVGAVPEPSTWAMLLLGFAGIGFMAYRRKPKPAFMAA
jgi:PEP-CTERM motif